MPSPVGGEVGKKPYFMRRFESGQMAPIPIVRVGMEPSREAAKPMRGFVKGGVVHLLDGARLPDGTFVKITRES